MLKKRIPTIIGLLLLIIGAFGGVLFINKSTDFLPRAAPEYAPQKVKITNLTENGFNVSWVTQESVIGFVKYGEAEGNLNTTAVDERDQLTGKSNEYRTHYITIQNLKPGKLYFFKLGSYKNQLYDNNGKAFQIQTPATLTTPPPADTAYGTVLTTANTPAEGAIVYVSIDGATPVSGLVKQNGNWAVNLSTARTADLQSYASYDPQSTRLDILVQPSTGEVAKANTTTGNDQPVPTMTLGGNYDFSGQQSTVAPTSNQESDVLKKAQDAAHAAEATPLPESKFSMQSIQATEGEIDPTLSITSIPKDGAVVSSQQPEIKGKAPANSTLIITVHSDQAYTDQVLTDAKGTWTWTPPGNLSPGEHTVSASYTDAQGILHKITRQFEVNSLGIVAPTEATPAYTATPSATVEPTVTPKPSPKATATPRPTPKSRTTIATESAHMVAGNTGITYIYLIFGFGMMGLGIKLAKKLA